MIDWEKVEAFDWDDGNLRKSADRHNVSRPEAEQVFFNQPLLVVEDVQHSEQEQRYHALGQTDVERYIHITFTLRGDDTLIRVISARDMSRKERKIYAQETQKDS